MSIFKKKKAEDAVLEPTARLQVGNYIIKEWGKSASPSGKVYNVPVITIEDTALTWRVSVEPPHSRHMLLQAALHWADVSPDGSVELPKGTLDMISCICALTFFMATEDFMLESGPDVKFLKAMTKAMKGYSDRRRKDADALQTETERENADTEALNDLKESQIINK